MGMLAGNGVDNKGGIEFKAPLMIEQAEELMLMARLGKSLEPVYYTKWQKKYLTRYWFVEKGTSDCSKWYQIDSIDDLTHF